MYAVAAGRASKQASNTSNVWLQTVATAGTGGRKRHSASPARALVSHTGAWETALKERRETICMMDANIDCLTWTTEDLPGHHSSNRLRPLSQALFTRILPLGVVQLVTCATRAECGVSETGLGHLYSNSPDKLAEVKAEFTGMLDHKIISVRKFTKDMKRTERYTTKRMFKSFQPDQFQAAVRSMPELEECLATPCPSTAATILTNGLTRILNNMAPVKTIQNRKNFVH